MIGKFISCRMQSGIVMVFVVNLYVALITAKTGEKCVCCIPLKSKLNNKLVEAEKSACVSLVCVCVSLFLSLPVCVCVCVSLSLKLPALVYDILQRKVPESDARSVCVCVSLFLSPCVCVSLAWYTFV